MGKGDQKSRRGKIIIGSTGVRRPRKSKATAVIPVETVVKVKKVAEKAKAEPKPKAKVASPVTEPSADASVAPVKAVKKAVKKSEA